MPARSATRATAGSPSACIIRVNPVGPKTSGNAAGPPSSVVDGSMAETSCSTIGTNSTRAYADRARRSAASSPAAPSV